MIVDVTEPVHTFRVEYEFIDYDFTDSGGMAFLFDQIKKTAEIRHELQQMQTSRSWRYTRIFRRGSGQ
jgi:hypothetical protein